MSDQPGKTYHDVTHYGTHAFAAPPILPADTIGDAQIKADPLDLIDADKIEHRRAVALRTPIGSAVTAQDEIVHIFDADAVIEDVSIVAESVPTGDYVTSVDVKIWNGSSWTSVLSGGAQDIDSGDTDNTRQSLTLDGTPTAAAGYLLRVTVTVSGASGTQADGLCVDVKYTEAP